MLFFTAVNVLFLFIDILQVSGDSSDLDLTGSRFGTDTSAVSVLIGSAACAVTAVSDTQISCTVGALTAAEHTVSVNIASLG